MLLNLIDLENFSSRLIYEQAFKWYLSTIKEHVIYYTANISALFNTISVPVYRSRLHPVKNFNPVFITKISDVSYKPDSQVDSFGRVNRPKQSYFYSSDNISTCLNELFPNIKAGLVDSDVLFVTSGRWMIEDDLKLAVIPDFENPFMKSFIKKIKIDTLSKYQLFTLKGINELFRKQAANDNVYETTSAFCNAILLDSALRNNKIDGILYTSAKDGIGFNVALLPEIIDNKKIVLKELIRSAFTKEDINEHEIIGGSYITAKNINLEQGIVTW